MRDLRNIEYGTYQVKTHSAGTTETDGKFDTQKNYIKK